jgi:hypothetical protein
VEQRDESPTNPIPLWFTVILAATSGSDKAPTNFVFFALGENDNNNERADLDFLPPTGQAAAVAGT